MTSGHYFKTIWTSFFVAIGTTYFCMWLLDFGVFRMGWCGPENAASCAREWMGALSGWAAFAAALISLPYLVGQWHEAQKQTQFNSGDIAPSAIAFPHWGSHDVLQVEVANMNLMSILIERIDVLLPGYLINVHSVALCEAGKDKIEPNLLPDTEFDPRLPLGGWIDRSKTYDTAEIRLTANHKSTGASLLEWPLGTKVQVGVRMIGPKEKLLRLECEVMSKLNKLPWEQYHGDQAASSSSTSSTSSGSEASRGGALLTTRGSSPGPE